MAAVGRHWSCPPRGQLCGSELGQRRRLQRPRCRDRQREPVPLRDEFPLGQRRGLRQFLQPCNLHARDVYRPECDAWLRAIRNYALRLQQSVGLLRDAGCGETRPGASGGRRLHRYFHDRGRIRGAFRDRRQPQRAVGDGADTVDLRSVGRRFLDWQLRRRKYQRVQYVRHRRWPANERERPAAECQWTVGSRLRQRQQQRKYQLAVFHGGAGRRDRGNIRQDRRLDQKILRYERRGDGALRDEVTKRRAGRDGVREQLGDWRVGWFG